MLSLIPQHLDVHPGNVGKRPWLYAMLSSGHVNDKFWQNRSDAPTNVPHSFHTVVNLSPNKLLETMSQLFK